MAGKGTEKKHMVDFLFPAALFFVFALCALAVILFAARVYKKTVDSSNASFGADMACAYITERVHQNDEGRISLGEVEGKKAMVFETELSGSIYRTYIYEDGGFLKELFARDGAPLSAASGDMIMEIQNLEIEEIKTDLYKVTCTDNESREQTAIVGVRAEAAD